MDPELATLASAAATAVVKALTTTMWEQARAAIGALWRRAHPDRAEAVEAEIADTREQLVQAQQVDDNQAEADLVAEWRSRLRRLLAADPSLADGLRQLVEHLKAAQPEASGGVHIGCVNMQAEASDHGRVYQTLGDQHITER